MNHLFDKFAQIGHNVENHVFDNDTPESFYACHAEKQLSLLTKEPIGISKGMCPDCKKYFKKLAVFEKRTIYTADPKSIQIFYSNGEYYQFKFPLKK